MIRTVARGHVTDEMRWVYGTVLATQLAGIAAAKAAVIGETGSETLSHTPKELLILD